MITKLLRRDHFTSRKLFFVLYRMYIQYVRMYVRTYIRKCSMCVFECMYIRTYVFLHSITLSCFRIEYVQQCVNSVCPSQPRQRVYIVHFQVC